MSSFMGYAALQNIAQNGLIRACIETVSDDMSKNWIELKQQGDNKDKDKRKNKNNKQAKDTLPKMAMDGSKWVTMGKKREGSNGEKHGGSRVLIDTDSGKVLAGLGGKFTGQNVNAVKENSTTSSKNEKHYALPIVPKKQRKQQIIDFVKQRINIDLEKAVTGKDFKGYPYISIPGKKVGENEAILRQKILSPLQNHVEFVDGGGYGIAIVPKDFVQREKEERDKKKAKDEMPNIAIDGGSEGTNPFVLDGDFNEGEHPRDSDGKFTSNGESGNETEDDVAKHKQLNEKLKNKYENIDKEIINDTMKLVEKLLKLEYNDQEVSQAFTERGKNYGYYKQYRKNKKSSIENSKKSLQKRIDEHIAKIQDPKKYCKKENWSDFSTERKKNLMNHWLTEIRTSKIQIEICNYFLENKKES